MVLHVRREANTCGRGPNPNLTEMNTESGSISYRSADLHKSVTAACSQYGDGTS